MSFFIMTCQIIRVHSNSKQTSNLLAQTHTCSLNLQQAEDVKCTELSLFKFVCASKCYNNAMDDDLSNSKLLEHQNIYLSLKAFGNKIWDSLKIISVVGPFSRIANLKETLKRAWKKRWQHMKHMLLQNILIQISFWNYNT